MEITINQSVDVKRTVNRSTIYLVTKIHKKPKIRLWWPNQQKFHNSHRRPQVLAQRAQFYCKLHQQLQEIDSAKSTRVKFLFDNGSQRSYVTDNLKSRLGLKYTKKMLHLNTFGEKTFRKQKCDVPTLFLEDVHHHHHHHHHHHFISLFNSKFYRIQ